MGKKNFATYRLIISEKARDTQGRILENLGDFNPHKEDGFVVKADRIKYWLGQGAQTSDTVHNLFLSKGIITAAPKKKAVYISKKRAAKLAEKKKANEPKAAPASAEAPAGEPAA